MADPDPNERGFFGGFATREVPKLVTDLIDLQTTARTAGMVDFANGVGRIVTGFLTDLNEAAREHALIADEQIKRRIEATRAANRPPSNEMSTHIVSEPGPLGSVGVAKMTDLDKIVNAGSDYSRTYGPFWAAQEFGTGVTMEYGPYAGEGIPSQEGRILYGTFEPSGDRPDPEQRGLRVGRDLAFHPAISGYDDDNAGWGRISVDLPGRHFLRDGLEEAGAKWLTKMGAIQAKWMRALEALLAEMRTPAGSSYTFTGRIEA